MIAAVKGVGVSIVRIVSAVLLGLSGRNPEPIRPTPRPPEYRQ